MRNCPHCHTNIRSKIAKTEFTLEEFKKLDSPPTLREFKITIPTPNRGADIHRSAKFIVKKRLSGVIGLGKPWYRNYQITEASADPQTGDIVIKTWNAGPPEPKK